MNMHVYEGYHFWGMHLMWWICWVVFIVWIFATPYSIPFQSKKKNSSLEILRKRFANGEINEEQYLERKKILDMD